MLLLIVCCVSLNPCVYGRPLFSKGSSFHASKLAVSQTESKKCDLEPYGNELFETLHSLNRQKRKIYEKPLLSKSRLRKRGKPGFWQWKLRMDPEAKSKNLKDAEEYIKAGYKLDPEAQAAAEAEVDAITPPSCGDIGNPQFARPRKKGRGPRKKGTDEYEEIDDDDPMFPRRSLTSGLFGNSKKAKKVEEVLKPGDTTLPRKRYLEAKCELTIPMAKQVSANKWTIRHSSASLPPPAILSKKKSGFGFPRRKPEHANWPTNQRTSKGGVISSEDNTPDGDDINPAFDDLILHENDDDDEYEKIPDDDEENGDSYESGETDDSGESHDGEEIDESGKIDDSDGKYSEEGHLVHQTNAGLQTKNGKDSKVGSTDIKVHDTNRKNSRNPKIGPKETKQDLVAKEERGSAGGYSGARRKSRTKTSAELMDTVYARREGEVSDHDSLLVRTAINYEKDVDVVSTSRNEPKTGFDKKADLSKNAYSDREDENDSIDRSKRAKPITGIVQKEIAGADRTTPKKLKTGLNEMADLTATDHSDCKDENDGSDSSKRTKAITGIVENEVTDPYRKKRKKPKTGLNKIADLAATDHSDREDEYDSSDSSKRRKPITGMIEKGEGADRARQNKPKAWLNEKADLEENDYNDYEDKNYSFDSSSSTNSISGDAAKEDASLAAAEKLISGLDKKTARLVNGDSDNEEDEGDRGAGHRRRKPKKSLVRRGRIKTVLTYGARTQNGAKGTASLVCENGAWYVRTSEDMLDRFVCQWNGTEPAQGYIKVLVQSGKWYTYRADRLPVKMARFLARLPLEYIGRTETFTYKGGGWYVVGESGSATRIVLQGSLMGSNAMYAVTDTGKWYPVDRERMFKLALYLADLPIAERTGHLEPVARKARA